MAARREYRRRNGEKVDAFGAEWYALSPAGAKVEKNGAKSTSPGGYGY